MTNLTLAIPDELAKKMKLFREIRWSEIARQSIIEKALLLKKSIHSKDLINFLPPETKKSIELADEKSSMKFYKSMKGLEWKRKKYLTQA